MRDIRRVIESPVEQGADEEIAYTLTTTPWASTPTSPSVAVFDESAADADVTATVSSGSASVAGDVITLPTIADLIAKHIYRIEVKFTAGGNVWESYFHIRAQ